jgi:hypothetical protein
VVELIATVRSGMTRVLPGWPPTWRTPMCSEKNTGCESSSPAWRIGRRPERVHLICTYAASMVCEASGDAAELPAAMDLSAR